MGRRTVEEMSIQFGLLRHRVLITELIRSSSTATASRMGAPWLWPLLIPIVQTAIYLFLFSVLFGRNTSDATVALVFGMLTWSVATSTLGSVTGAIIGATPILTQLKVEPGVFIAASFGESIWSLRYGVLMSLVIPLTTLKHTSLELIAYPIIFAGWAIFLWGLTLIVGTLAVFVRDMSIALPYILTIIMLVSPVLYTRGIFPVPLQQLQNWNPVATIFELFRWSVLGMEAPPIASVAMCCLVICLQLVAGEMMYRRLAPKIPKML